MDISYVLPILRRQDDDGLEELTDYLRWLSERAEVIVADGSAPDLVAEHRILWASYATHLPVTNRAGRNGKVLGVHVGMAAASHERAIIADDDVRYSDRTLRDMRQALAWADLVRPQNYFSPVPWHAAWDTARILLNRALGADSPGTLGVRRSFFMSMGGYSDEVMYENLELIRTVTARGGRIAERPDIFVRRLPGSSRRFCEQRPRQAYDDFAQPVKMIGFLAVLPTIGWALSSGIASARVAAMTASVTVGLAEWGRLRFGGSRFFPARTAWFAPLWVLERCVCVWLAVLYRLTGGVPYAGTRFRVAAHSSSELRRRAAANAVASVTKGDVARAPAAAEGDH